VQFADTAPEETTAIELAATASGMSTAAQLRVIEALQENAVPSSFTTFATATAVVWVVVLDMFVLLFLTGTAMWLCSCDSSVQLHANSQHIRGKRRNAFEWADAPPKARRGKADLIGITQQYVNSTNTTRMRNGESEPPLTILALEPPPAPKQPAKVRISKSCAQCCRFLLDATTVF
jgi:hypothetical protein